MTCILNTIPLLKHLCRTKTLQKNCINKCSKPHIKYSRHSDSTLTLLGCIRQRKKVENEEKNITKFKKQSSCLKEFGQLSSFLRKNPYNYTQKGASVSGLSAFIQSFMSALPHCSKDVRNQQICYVEILTVVQPSAVVPAIHSVEGLCRAPFIRPFH